MRGHYFHFEPDPDARPVSPATLRRVASTFTPYKSKVLGVAVLILVTSGLGVINPLLIKVIFDRALFVPGGPNLELLFFLVGLMFAIPIVSGVLGIWQTYLSNLVGQRVMQDFRNKLYAHLQRMALRFFTSTRTGEIQSRLSNDVGGVQSVVTDTASGVLSNVVIVISTVVAMLLLSWQLTLLSLGILPFFFWLTHRVGKARREVAASTQRSLADLSTITEETLSVSGILLSKAFGRQEHETARFRRENERLAGLQIRQQMIGRSFFATIQIFFSVTPALVYLVAGLVMNDGSAGLTAGTIVAFTTLQSRLFFPVGQMLQVSVEVQSAMALFERIFEYLDMPHEITDRPDARSVDPEGVKGHVRLRDVRFRYEAPPEADDRATPVSPEVMEDGQRREWTLQGVDLEVKPGQLAALVGPSGAGKTTVTYLIPRFYDVNEGAVEIDGVDVRDIRLDSLGEIIGMVTQETYLFHSSVRDNLLYGKPHATNEELEAAAKAAFIHDRIMELPEGYDTLVGERGYKLSGGEKQRLAIARTILKDPRILILDEATSSLDTTSERLVQEALRPLMEGRTTIAIAHRLSTILAADVIFFMDRGRVVERGSHAELLARGGRYASLYHQQFRDGAVEAECEDGVVMASGDVVSRTV
ncbi:MAG TPA: ABC transporter ATP-binding protein [Actinomycetota bacterium]|nr:ABC transporter ATP-binding protein [Actinomycetota bacterium]